MIRNRLVCTPSSQLFRNPLTEDGMGWKEKVNSSRQTGESGKMNVHMMKRSLDGDSCAKIGKTSRQ